ncbi:MAG: translation initiation factor IF-3 [Nitrospirae bacterium]|nr:translation initiation factor IF-3 [Nitrospirota bacterium]MCL5422642.1 translation initiation factor IF-3 [Nitrospirota bacterium]
MNTRIHAKTVRLIDADGSQAGVVPLAEALRLADERGFDLVEVAPNSVPPVCKIMDFGKYKYQLSKKHTARKTIEVKEVKLRPQIGEHDLELKARNIRRFLDDGNKAKVTMFFRGREMVRPDLGMKVFDRLLQYLDGKFTLEQAPRQEGKNITMVVAPSSK